MNFFAKLRNRHAEKKQKAMSDIQQIAQCIANGEEPDVEFVFETLESTGETPEQLKLRVEREVARLNLKSKAAMLPKLYKDSELVGKQLEALDKKLSEIQADMEDKMHPLRCQMEDLRLEIISAEDAQRELKSMNFKFASDAQKAELQTLTSNVQKLSKALEDKKTYLTRLVSEAIAIKGRLGNLMPAAHKKSLEDDLRSYSETISRTEDSKRQLESDLQAAEKARYECEQSILNG